MLWHVYHYHVPCGQTAIQMWIVREILDVSINFIGLIGKYM